MLLNIFNKVIKNLSPTEKQNIFNNYIGVNYEVAFDYVLFWKIFTIFAIVILIVYVRYIIINNYNQKIKKYFEIIDSNFLTSTADLDGNITDVSEALCKMTGYTRDELIGKNHNIFRHKDMPKSVFKEMWDTILSGKIWEGEVKNLKKDGSYYWAQSKITPIFRRDGSIKGFSAIRHDITDKKKLEKLSVTDSLTQIPNRLYLNTNYEKEVKRAKRYKHEFSIILIDVDFFKKVNDTYGHSVGDDCLKQIAKILKENIRSIDILGRWGGEEFLIISPETDIHEAQVIAEKIRQKISEFNFPVIGHVTCSFGISQYHPEDKAEESFQRADKALYEAKNSGRNKISILR
jgi:diguanylate cyclase (GGDEF)-like protein/PAS domain S-box-containing protein